MKPKKDYPFGRVRQDTIAQPIRTKQLAATCKQIMERMTGDQCDVVWGRSCCWLLRYTGERWERA